MCSIKEFNLADSSKFLSAENVLLNEFSLRTTAGKESGSSQGFKFCTCKKGASKTPISAKCTNFFAILNVTHQAHAKTNKGFLALMWI
jgi:hypothetical protein